MSCLSWAASALVSSVIFLFTQRSLFDLVEAGPGVALLDVGLAQVDARVEVVREGLRHGFDALVWGAREREEFLRGVDFVGLDGGDECVDLAL